jgi:hypothetical protein
MDWDKHTLGIGRLWSALLSLELVLRFCINRKTNQSAALPKFDTMNTGDILDRNVLIDCDTLANVIDKFNSEFREMNESVEKDRIAPLRNAIGHGKIIAEQPSPLNILNFEDYDRTHVKLIYFEEITEDWIKTNMDFLNGEILRLRELYNSLLEETS